MSHFEKCEFQPDMISFQWFASLFTYSFNFDVISCLWDVYFLKKDKMLFRLSLAIFGMAQSEFMKCQDII